MSEVLEGDVEMLREGKELLAPCSSAWLTHWPMYCHGGYAGVSVSAVFLIFSSL